MKHEYTFEELAELRKIYDESGEAGLNIHEMRVLRKAGLLTQSLPEKTGGTVKRELILAHCKNRIDQGQPFDGKETRRSARHEPENRRQHSRPTPRKEGLLPAFDKHSPRSKARKTTTTGKKKETMTTTTSKITADNVTESKIAATDIITAKLPTAEMAPEKEREHTRAAITDALVYIYDAISALQKTAFQTNDKVVYGFATKLLNGELMDLKANYSKDVAK